MDLNFALALTAMVAITAMGIVAGVLSKKSNAILRLVATVSSLIARLMR